MHILVVEDDSLKRAAIVECIRRLDSNIAVTEARSYNSGIVALLGQVPDLLILDMTMPSFDISPSEDGGPPQAFAGLELMRYITRRGHSPQTIVVTQFERFGEGPSARTRDELAAVMRQEFGRTFLGIVYYDSRGTGWQSQIVAAVRQTQQERPR